MQMFKNETIGFCIVLIFAMLFMSACTHNINLNLITEEPLELTVKLDEPVKLDLDANVALNNIAPVKLSVSEISPAQVLVGLKIDEIPPIRVDAGVDKLPNVRVDAGIDKIPTVKLDAGIDIERVPHINLTAKVEGSDKPVKIQLPLDNVKATIGLDGKLHIDGLPGSGSPIDIDPGGWCNKKPLCEPNIPGVPCC